MNTCLKLLPVLVSIGLFVCPPIAVQAGGPHFTEWGAAVPDADIANSVAGGCPHESRDGLTMYMASARAGGNGDLDIWIASRPDVDEPFGAASNLGEPVNSPYADFCPTPLGGGYLMFVSTRPAIGACGSGDMYVTRENPSHGWEEPVNLGCAVAGEGPNTAGGEFSPSLVETSDGVYLFYSSNATGNMDLYVSALNPDGTFEPGVPVDELNTEFDDRMPNVSKDGREIVYSSDRPTWAGGEPAVGGQDVYMATREHAGLPWSDPVNLGTGINTGDDETRASMSWDGLRLHFGRAGEIFVSERARIRGPK